MILSTLTLIEAESELKTMRRLCAQDDFLVVAKDMAADVLRLSPQREGMMGVIQYFRDAIEGRYTAAALNVAHCNGYWHSGRDIRDQAITMTPQDR